MINGSISDETAVINFDAVKANPAVSKYQLTVASLISPQLPPTTITSFGARTIIMESVNSEFIVTSSEISRYFNSGYATLDSPYLLLRVEAVNGIGNSKMSNGIYFEPQNFGLSIYSLPQPTLTPVATPTPTKQVSKRTIVCIKGKLFKKVKGISPKCPAGYKVKP